MLEIRYKICIFRIGSYMFNGKFVLNMLISYRGSFMCLLMLRIDLVIIIGRCGWKF